MRLIATSRPFKISPVVSSDSEDSDVEILEDTISVVRSPSPSNNVSLHNQQPSWLSDRLWQIK